MTVFNDTFRPIELKDRGSTLNYIVERSMGIRRSIRFIEKEPDHLTLRLPGCGEYIEVTGTEAEVMWLDDQLLKRDYYRH